MHEDTGFEGRRPFRQRWLSALATAPESVLEQFWQALEQKPTYEVVRRPEVGMIMVRGQTGGTGTPFNLGELPVTRCAVRVAGGSVGVGYIKGRKPRHAELIAVFDSLLQDDTWREQNAEILIGPLEAERAERRRRRQSQVAKTQVEFFTMVRGDG